MMYKIYNVLVPAALALALPGMAVAGKFTWFDESPSRDSLGQLRPPSSIFNRDTRVVFGVDAYKSLAPVGALEEEVDSREGDAVVRLYGEVGSNQHDFYRPLAALNRGAGEAPPFDSTNNRLSGFGVKWQHRFDATNTFALSAGYSESSPWTTQSTPSIDMLDTRAALSWTGQWPGSLQPGMTGSLFVGDEMVRDEMYQRLGRRYYGFTVGGQLRVAQEHTPYLSYRMRRDFYSVDDPNYLIVPYEDRSQISAGWKWQVQPNWSVHAEASYGLNGANLDPNSPDRSRIFFGTRFDFR